MKLEQRWEVVSEGVILGDPTAALVRSWTERGTRSWVTGMQIEPGLWTDSSGEAGARTKMVTLRPVA